MRLEEVAVQDDKSIAAMNDGIADGGETQAQSLADTASKTETAIIVEQSIVPPETEADADADADADAEAEADADDEADDEGQTPNSKPRKPELEVESYVYRDFSTIVAPPPQSLNPQSLQAQKLPAKLASMLSDPDLINMIAWSPHGRSWRVINRDLFSEIALRHYFGHKNYASFVRIVNAWGFRRITHGADRDSYYHELFLRGRPDLHQRMKRLATSHRKTPINKEDQCPNFYDLAKTSPLPEIAYQRAGQVIPNVAQIGQPGIVPGQMTQFSPMSLGVPTVATLGPLGGAMGNINEHVLSLLSNDAAARSLNNINIPSIAATAGNSVGQLSLPRVAQLQRDNEELRRRLLEMENMQAQQGGVGGFGNQGRAGSQSLSLVPDQRAVFSSNMTGAVNPAAGSGGGNIILERELERMHRDFMLRSNTPMNNSLLSSFGGGGVVGSGGGDGSNFSFMTGYPRDEMLLRAMRLENQMGYLQQSSQGQSSAASSLERALQQQNNNSTNASSMLQAGDDGTKAVMDWVAKQQQQQQQHSL